MKINDADRNNRMYRRSMVRKGTALIGAGFIGSFTPPSVELRGKAVNNVFNVRDFGATGNIGDNSTMPVRSVVDDS